MRQPRACVPDRRGDRCQHDGVLLRVGPALVRRAHDLRGLPVRARLRLPLVHEPAHLHAGRRLPSAVPRGPVPQLHTGRAAHLSAYVGNGPVRSGGRGGAARVAHRAGSGRLRGGRGWVAGGRAVMAANPVDRCAGFKSCAECTAQPMCGWCPHAGNSPNGSCMYGTWQGPAVGSCPANWRTSLTSSFCIGAVQPTPTPTSTTSPNATTTPGRRVARPGWTDAPSGAD